MADISIKDDDWNSLSEQEQKQIQDIFPNDNLVPSPDGAAAANEAPSPQASEGSDLACEAGCLATYESVKKACTRIKSPIGKGLCYAAAYGAYLVCCEVCKRKTSNSSGGGGDTNTDNNDPPAEDNNNPSGGDDTSGSDES